MILEQQELLVVLLYYRPNTSYKLLLVEVRFQYSSWMILSCMANLLVVVGAIASMVT